MFNKRDRYGDSSRIETIQCPVCKSILGQRDFESIFMSHCDECRATFCWKPREVKPTVEMDKHREKQRCGCNGCGR